MHLDAMEKVVSMVDAREKVVGMEETLGMVDAMEKVVGMEETLGMVDAREKVLGMEEMLAEIALRIPPTDPARLVRLSLSFKKWQGVLTSSSFLQAYAARHSRPPFLGYFHSAPVKDPQIDRFVPAAAGFPTFSPAVGTDSWYVLDVRQGRVLLFTPAPALIVWLPITGEHSLLPHPPRDYQYQAGAVMCAKSPQCNDPECFSSHYFRVIFAGCEDKLGAHNGVTFFEGNQTWTCIYNEQTEEWGEVYLLDDDRYGEHPLLDENPPVLHEDTLYFTLEMHDVQGEDVRGALKFDLTNLKLSVVLTPGDAQPDFGMFVGTSQGVGFAVIEEYEVDEIEDVEGFGRQTNLSVWTNPADWSLTWDINLDATLPAGAIQPANMPTPAGFVEGEEAMICIESGARIFTIELESSKTADFGPSAGAHVIPFFHFYMPSLPKVSPSLPKEKGDEYTGIASEESDQKKEADADAAEEEGRNALVKADVVGIKRRIQVDTPSDKKAKGDQIVNLAGAEESSSSSSEDEELNLWI